MITIYDAIVITWW